MSTSPHGRNHALDLDRVGRVVQDALVMAVPILRDGVRGHAVQQRKQDGSVCTDVDRAAETEIIRILDDALPGDIAVIAEEGGRARHVHGARYALFVDPQDGTVSGRIRSTTATAGACIYDTAARRFLVACVVDPFGGRLWWTSGGRTRRRLFNVYTLAPGDEQECTVAGDTVSDPEVLIDILHPFTRTDAITGVRRGVLGRRQILRLVDTIQDLGAHVRTCSSNLHHQALVADGGDAVAAIMAAVGGPWDMSGLALVENSGGVVAYVTVNGLDIEVTDDPLAADVVVSAAHRGTLDRLVEAIRTACARDG